jgi:hypothetical protein
MPIPAIIAIIGKIMAAKSALDSLGNKDAGAGEKAQSVGSLIGTFKGGTTNSGASGTPPVGSKRDVGTNRQKPNNDYATNSTFNNFLNKKSYRA